MKININFDLIKNKFDEIYHKDASKLKITPFRDWAIVFTSTFILLLIVFSFAGYVYVNLYIKNQSGVQTVEVKKTIPKGNDLKSEFGETISVFEEKKQTHNDFLNRGAKFFLDKMNESIHGATSTATSTKSITN